MVVCEGVSVWAVRGRSFEGSTRNPQVDGFVCKGIAAAWCLLHFARQVLHSNILMQYHTGGQDSPYDLFSFQRCLL